MTPQSAQTSTCSETSDIALGYIAGLNNTFRELYSNNRNHIIAETPLIGLTLIGTGEIFRFEYGQHTKCYRPVDTLPKIKGLMHSILGAHGVWRILLREKNGSTARNAVTALHMALEDAVARLSDELPEELIIPARTVLVELLHLSEAWNSGKSATIEDFPVVLAGIQKSLQDVVRLTGDAAYSSLVQSFKAFCDESDPESLKDYYVGVCGPGQGRRDNIEIAAAMAVMGKEAVGLRLLYLENALTIPDGLKVLASIIVERDLGKAVFDDPYRMWRDLLADAAIEHVGGSFFPQLGPSPK